MMNWVIQILWLIPVLPLAAAGALALAPRSCRRLASGLSISTLAVSFILSCAAFIATLQAPGGGGETVWRQFRNFSWLQVGQSSIQLGWVLDPLTAAMLVMVTFIGLLIFIYSTGYMAEDPNFTRFFCFLSLFAAAMLGLIIANSLLLLFVCWELVGLASFLLIGFWYEKPSAVAAARKAFITTRIGDIGLFIGMLWLYSETGTLVFYDGGNGCLEQSALSRLAGQMTIFGMVASTAISLFIYIGAAGKSGQVPLHVWLPDAMEGPTPVSALIHAATMVAAGVFLLARIYPLLDVDTSGRAGLSTALSVITWMGAITALLAAAMAVAQNDIKRILAYSTVSQLGFMMMGLGAGGVAVAMFHLITHAFFKALLFLGAGSVIHGCHGEQDIRAMGDLRKWMPTTFVTYMVGMMALSGVPLIFSGFWSKDEILHALHGWKVSHVPFYLGLIGSFLTAFYMTRQICYVFFRSREAHPSSAQSSGHSAAPHESPAVMLRPLQVLAAITILGSLFGTPAWPWFQSYLTGNESHFDLGHLFHRDVLSVLLLSSIIVLAGIGLGWRLYRRQAPSALHSQDILELRYPGTYEALKNRLYFDEFFNVTIVRLNGWLASLCDLADRTLWSGVTRLGVLITLAFAWLDRFVDLFLINGGFDVICRRLGFSGQRMARLQSGQVQHYLGAIGVGVALLVLIFAWGVFR